jgi:NAD(P)-dependent dehydrogenase (short-subunit alcohol dehydrogenase family)
MNALVTGGRRGIGLAIVQALKKAEYKVAVVAQSWDEPDCDLYIRHDLSMGASQIVPYVVDTLGGLDVLVNNAGAQVQYSVKEYDINQFKRQQDLMVNSAFEMSQAAAKHMTAGHIVNILSTASFQGVRNVAGYVTAKHALLGMTRALAVELAPRIHVNAVAPGLIETDMTSDITEERKALLNSITPAGRFGQPEEVAEAVMYLVNSTFVYGAVLTVDGGWMVKNG